MATDSKNEEYMPIDFTILNLFILAITIRYCQNGNNIYNSCN